MSGFARVVVALAFISSALSPTAAEEMPTIRVEMKDGTITPLRIEIAANRPFKLEIHNTGKTPAEFESTELNREKVVAPQSQSFIVFRRLSPGEYVYLDDFHPEAPKGTLVAK